MDIAKVLSGHARLADAQWALLARPVRKVLRSELGALLADGHTLGSCRLQRAKFKPGRKLTAYYAVCTRQPGASASRIRPVAVTWMPQGTSAAEPSATATSLDVLAMQAEALCQGLAAPFQRLVAEVPAWGMRLQVSPLDVRFPQLVRLSDPKYVRDMLAATYDSGVLAAQYTVTPIRYRPGQRHVLRYDPVIAGSAYQRRLPNGGVIFAKLYSSSEERARFYRIARQIADWLALCGPGLSAIRAQSCATEIATVLYPHIAGTVLSGYLRGTRRDVASYLWQAGIMLRALHAAPAAVTTELEPHSFSTEVRLIARACEHIQVLLPSTGETITMLLNRAQALYERLPQESPTLVHGDFKADHLWVTRSGLTLIDFDACRLADPALDVGKFLADLHWWYVLSNRRGLERGQVQFLEGYGLDAKDPRLVRARLYEVLWLVKITARRVRLFDHAWVQRTEQMIGHAEAALDVLAQPTASSESLQGALIYGGPRGQSSDLLPG